MQNYRQIMFSIVKSSFATNPRSCSLETNMPAKATSCFTSSVCSRGKHRASDDILILSLFTAQIKLADITVDDINYHLRGMQVSDTEQRRVSPTDETVTTSTYE
jgi:hypothetical protein